MCGSAGSEDPGSGSVAEGIDDPETVDDPAVLEIFGEQDIRPGAQCGLDDQRVPVRQTRHPGSTDRGSHQPRMEGLDLEPAKRIDRSTCRVGGQRDGKLSGDR